MWLTLTSSLFFFLFPGIIRLQRQLDREEYSNITFTVLAIDEKGPHPLTSTATVYVNVVDMNDNRPRFITQEYVYSVYENAKLNTLIATIKAVDDDNGAYGKVHYSLETTDQDLPFRIDEDTVSWLWIVKKIYILQWNDAAKRFSLLKLIRSVFDVMPMNCRSSLGNFK